MHVRIDETGHDGLPLEIDHFALAFATLEDLRVGADGDDARVRHRQGGGPGCMRVARIEMAMDEKYFLGIGAARQAPHRHQSYKTQKFSRHVQWIPRISKMQENFVSHSSEPIHKVAASLEDITIIFG